MTMKCNIPSNMDETSPVKVWIKFDTIFTRGIVDEPRKRLRFDYLIKKTKMGTHEVERL